MADCDSESESELETGEWTGFVLGRGTDSLFVFLDVPDACDPLTVIIVQKCAIKSKIHAMVRIKSCLCICKSRDQLLFG